ncbi:MAG: hypothetical protein H6Q39_168 [Chloroflexi bacterium]|nr:hypothetical protein [Chloroflexota bacterium]
MALMEITVVPLGAGTSLSKYVAKAIRALESVPEVDYELTSMGTIVLGRMDRLLEAAQKMHQAVLDAGAQRVETIIRIDDRRDKTVTLASKLAAVQKELGDRD